MIKTVKIFPSPQLLAEVMALILVNQINDAERRKSPVTIALSGGNTPTLLFSVLADKYADSVNWRFVHFFWVDERCVSPDDPESNYGTVCRILFDKITIPDSCIHRIIGEDDPEKEAARYSHEILKFVRSADNLPVFDHIVLGMGADGHTASIFPGNIKLFKSEEICDVTTHPLTGQKRVTITGSVINNADNITFLVTGHNKSGIIDDILQNNLAADNYPAAKVVPLNGKVHWLIDKEAGSLLKSR